MNERLLLQITDIPGTGTQMDVRCNNPEDLFRVCVTLRQAMQQNRLFCEIMANVDRMFSDKNFVKYMEEHSIEMPDFNAILRNNNPNDKS